MTDGTVIAHRFALAPHEGVWFPLPSGVARARIGRTGWVAAAARRLCQNQTEGEAVLGLAARRCAELYDRAPDTNGAVLLARGEPHAMLGIFRVGAGVADDPMAAWEPLTEEVSEFDGEPFTNVTRTMRSGILGDRLMFGVDFEGELEGVRVRFGGTTDQPIVAGQFAVEGARLFLTLRWDPTCRRS